MMPFLGLPEASRAKRRARRGCIATYPISCGIASDAHWLVKKGILLAEFAALIVPGFMLEREALLAKALGGVVFNKDPAAIELWFEANWPKPNFDFHCG